MNNRTFYIVIVILATVTAIGFMNYLPTRLDSAANIKVAEFPVSVGGWTSKEIVLSKRDYKILETTNLFVRDYKNSKGEVVNFYLIYSDDNRKVSHPPEICYMGSGVTITDKSQVQITDSIRANKLLVELADSRQLVVYWYKARDLHTNSYLKQQLKVVLDRTFGKSTSGALIRLSADIVGDDEDAALELIRSFYAEIASELEEFVP
ncbi:exosortase C-terminal domain/associated protein EpsI [Candidatus Omnitrophota bacterium]